VPSQGLFIVLQSASAMQSNAQLLLQPTPVPFSLPRSHCSLPSITPSPHTAIAPPEPPPPLLEVVVELELAPPAPPPLDELVLPVVLELLPVEPAVWNDSEPLPPHPAPATRSAPSAALPRSQDARCKRMGIPSGMPTRTGRPARASR
jgi:hypothetical protein